MQSSQINSSKSSELADASPIWLKWNLQNLQDTWLSRTQGSTRRIFFAIYEHH